VLIFPYKVTVVLFALLTIVGHFGLFEILNENFAKPIEFRTRTQIDRDPVFDERIRIFAFDDVTVSKLGRQSLTYEELLISLAHLSKHKPKLIVIDQVFQIVTPEPGISSLVEEKSRLSPIVAAVFSALQPIAGRNHIDQNPKFPSSQPRPYWKSRSDQFVYGPDPRIRPLFSGFGGINYGQHGQMPVAVQSENGVVFPNLGLTVASTFKVVKNDIEVDGKSIPLTPKGDIQANQGPLGSYFSRTRTIASLLDAANRDVRIKGLDQDSYVFILPMMYTGNTDFKSTPHGEFSGGLLHVAIANSVLTGQWISYFGGATWFALLAGAATIIASHFLTPFRTAMLILVQLGALLIAGLGLFAYKSTVIPWSESGAMALFVGLAAIAEKARVVERRSLQVKHTLAGLVPAKLLRALLKAPTNVLENSTRTDLTIMFVDIEGFSLKMQDEDPTLVFSKLKMELGHLCQIVQKHGGIVDKTLGDGLLCYFGYSFDPSFSQSDREHAFAAMSCALDIQIDSARRAVAETLSDGAKAKNGGRLVFPLRIGINTGEVFVGNVGNAERIDMTIVGPAVNWAKRFEDVCESFRIMIGPRTKQIITRNGPDSKSILRIGDRDYTLYHRDIIVKHYEEKRSAWECNPFERSVSLLTAALDAVNVPSIDGRQARVKVRMPAEIRGCRLCSIVQIGMDGGTVVSDSYLSKRDTIEVAVCMDPTALKTPIAAKNGIVTLDDPLNTRCFRAIVLWGIQEDGRSRHGLRFVDLSEADREHLRAFLETEASGVVKSPSADPSPSDNARLSG
jgi:class 3 adenylate cyclase